MLRTYLTILALIVSSVAWSCPTYNLVVTDNGGGSYTFDLNFSGVGGGTSITSVNWDFGDGTVITNTNEVMTHQFATNGNYNVLISYSAFVGSGGLGSACGITLPQYAQTVTNVVPNIPCPVATFAPLSPGVWCFTGEMSTGWFYCNEDYDLDGTPDNYWTPDSVAWNMGDGQTEVSYGTTNVAHTYGTNVPSPITITATAYFTGLNGEQCAVPLVYMLDDPTNYQPCVLANDPTLPNVPYNQTQVYSATAGLFANPSSVCADSLFSVYNNGVFVPALGIPGYGTWSYELFINGQSVAGAAGMPDNTVPIYTGTLPVGDHTIEIVYTYGDIDILPCSISESILITVDDCAEPCETCNSFKPIPGDRYWVSAWVQEDHGQQVKTYTDAYLEFEFMGSGLGPVQFRSTGEIIEGWQRIVGSFTIPANTSDLNISLVNTNAATTAFFDDIRIHPYNASLKTYVYDHKTLWLTAELDDNNYATYYEYDEEGNLIRIEKETARGVVTIQESRSSNPKEN